MTQETDSGNRTSAAGGEATQPPVLAATTTTIVTARLARWGVTSERQVLHDRIVQVSTPQFGAFYLEALRTLREGGDEVRITVAGHMLREVHDGLRKEHGVPKVGGGAGLFWDWVREEWTKLLTKWPAPSAAAPWEGRTIDRVLGSFLHKLPDEIGKMLDLRPKQREQHAQTLRQIDSGFAGAPSETREGLVKAWMDFSDLFNTATHSSDAAEFEDGVQRFEAFLGDRLIPATFEKQTAIADFVQGVESGA